MKRMKRFRLISLEGEVSQQDLLADPKQESCQLVLRKTLFTHNEYEKYYQLIHISILCATRSHPHHVAILKVIE